MIVIFVCNMNLENQHEIKNRHKIICDDSIINNSWSWRDSNPRPNKQYASFLHAYFAIGFRHKADSKQPTLRLSSKIFVPEPKFFGTYFRIFYASESNVAEQNFRETSCFLTILREKR